MDSDSTLHRAVTAFLTGLVANRLRTKRHDSTIVILDAAERLANDLPALKVVMWAMRLCRMLGIGLFPPLCSMLDGPSDERTRIAGIAGSGHS